MDIYKQGKVGNFDLKQGDKKQIQGSRHTATRLITIKLQWGPKFHLNELLKPFNICKSTKQPLLFGTIKIKKVRDSKQKETIYYSSTLSSSAYHLYLFMPIFLFFPFLFLFFYNLDPSQLACNSILRNACNLPLI